MGLEKSDDLTRMALPVGSIDCHFHIYGPEPEFPWQKEGRFAPDRDYTIEDAFRHWARHGISRGVIVHGEGAGEDNDVTFDALRRYPDRLRATAILSPSVTDRRLDEMTDVGFRAVRVTMIRQNGVPLSTKGTSFADFQLLAPRLAARGWHAELWIECSDLEAAAPELEKLPTPYVVDHMCRTMAAKGAAHPDYQRFLDRLRSGRYWTKISGADRNSNAGRPYDDTRQFMTTILDAAPDQVVWGSDWPHVGHSAQTRPRMEDLVGLLRSCAPSAALMEKIMIANPKRLYGFA